MDNQHNQSPVIVRYRYRPLRYRPLPVITVIPASPLYPVTVIARYVIARYPLSPLSQPARYLPLPLSPVTVISRYRYPPLPLSPGYTWLWLSLVMVSVVMVIARLVQASLNHDLIHILILMT